MKNSIIYSFLLCTPLIAVPVQASNPELNISDDKAHAISEHGRALASVGRLHDNAESLEAATSGNSGPCPPFCVTPLSVEAGVATAAELEVISFMETALYSGDGVMIDVRSPDRFQQETLPGSTNVPFTVFEKPTSDPELAAVLEHLGAKQRGKVNVVMRTLEKAGLFGGEDKTDRWDFSEAKAVLLWCDNSWCEQSPRAISALVSLGYPVEKLSYYRGGMQMWKSLGLSTVVPTDNSTFASK